MHRFTLLFLFFFCFYLGAYCQACDPSSGCFGPNLVVDGDFESFNPGSPFANFSSNYPYNGVCVLNGNNCGGFLCQGEFAVEETPFPCNPGFSSNIVDHTFSDGTGHFMVVDFSNNQSARIWCQTINLAPNTEYCFGAWFINLLPSGTGSPPPIFRFEANGSTLAVSNGIPESEQWQFEGFTFNSGVGGITEICIYNHNFGAIGFDLGIDDISVKEVQFGTPPMPQPDFVDICNNGQPVVFDLLSNDMPGGSPLDLSTFSVSSAPPFTFGTITNVDQANGTVTFVPEGNFAQTSFFYEICDQNGCCASQEVQINRSPAIFSSWSATETTCDDPQSGSITLTINGGTPPFTFDWDNAPDVQNPTGLAAGLYTVTISDGGGCGVTAQAFVGGPPAADVIITEQDASCNGADDGSIEVTVNGGQTPFTFNWDQLPDQQIVNDVPAGSYSLTVTDGNGCEIFSSATINEPDALILTAMEDTPESCPGQNDGTGSITISGGTTPYAVEWPNGETGTSSSGLAAGQYLITITDANQCSGTVTLDINGSADLVVMTSGTDAICFGINDGTAAVVVTDGTPPFTYLWSTGATNDNISNLAPGAYTVTVNDANGCVVSAMQSISELMPVTADMMTTPVTCFGEADGSAMASVTSGTAPFSFLWDNGSTDQTVTGLVGGQYAVTINDVGGCLLFESVEVPEATEPLNVSFNDSNASCVGDADGFIAAMPTGGMMPYTFAWNNGMTLDSLSGLSSGDFTLTLTDLFGCQVVESITLDEPVEISFDFSSSPITCFEGSDGMITVDTVIGGTEPYLYSIDGENFQISNTFTGLSAGNYIVFVEDLNECSETAAVNLIQPPPIFVQLGEDISLELGDSTELSNSVAGIPGFSFQWTPEAYLSCSDCPRPVVFPFETVTYQLEVTDVDGCTATDDITVEVIKNFDTFIPNAFSPNNDGINDVFMIFGGKSVAAVSRLVVYNRWGELVHEAAGFPPNSSVFGWDGTFKGKPLSPGVFVYYTEVIFLDGTVQALKGDVTLIR